ncbi:MAG: hypothetical protein MSO56_01515 [Clostridiales bacterium]|nr:hypothetical protein [Clostridiales bacterium]
MARLSAPVFGALALPVSGGAFVLPGGMVTVMSAASRVQTGLFPAQQAYFSQAAPIIVFSLPDLAERFNRFAGRDFTFTRLP